jgi:protein-S-isoprenylcysteine O-methyltransferase Ste14
VKRTLITTLVTALVPGVAVGLVPYWIVRAAHQLAFPPAGFLKGLCVTLALIGAGMVMWVSLVFVRQGMWAPVPVAPQDRLVAQGLYGYVRNPMYVGALLVLVAEAIFFRSAWVLLYSGFLWLALHTFTVLIEEPDLERRLGDSYREYKTKTPRWIPRRPAT